MRKGSCEKYKQGIQKAMNVHFQVLKLRVVGMQVATPRDSRGVRAGQQGCKFPTKENRKEENDCKSQSAWVGSPGIGG